MKVFAIINQKGGVGKTTTAVNLGVGLAKTGRRVLLIDLDPQSDLTDCLGIKDPDLTIADALTNIVEDSAMDYGKYIVKNDEGVDIIPSNLDLSSIEIPLVQALGGQLALKELISCIVGYDFVVIDCPPSLGILTINALAAATDVIIPVKTQPLAMKGMAALINTAELVRKRLNPMLKIRGILYTEYEKNTKVTKNTVANCEAAYGGIYPIFKTYIPKAVRTAESSATGTSMFSYDPSSAVTLAYMSVCKECISKDD